MNARLVFLLILSVALSSLSARTALAFFDGGSWVGRREFSRPTDVKLSADRVLIVTHVCTQWDEKCTTRAGNDTTVDYARRRGIPVIFLQHSLDEKIYFCREKRPDYIIYSSGGEFTFRVPSTKVITTGGYYSYCQRDTMKDLLKAWSDKIESLEICTITPAIYEDAYSTYFPSKIRTRAESIIKRRGTHTLPFSELLNEFGDDHERMDYLKSRVEDYLRAHSMSRFRVEIRYRGKTMLVRSTYGAGASSFIPVLRFRYVHPRPGERLNVGECFSRL